MAIEIVDLPIEKWWFSIVMYSYVSLPEGSALTMWLSMKELSRWCSNRLDFGVPSWPCWSTAGPRCATALAGMAFPATSLGFARPSKMFSRMLRAKRTGSWRVFLMPGKGAKSHRKSGFNGGLRVVDGVCKLTYRWFSISWDLHKSNNCCIRTKQNWEGTTLPGQKQNRDGGYTIYIYIYTHSLYNIQPTRWFEAYFTSKKELQFHRWRF